MLINYSEGKELYFQYLILDAWLLHICHYTAKETAHLEKKNLIMYSTLSHIFEAKYEIQFGWHNIMQLRVIQQFVLKF